jgi:hypothetical protein
MVEEARVGGSERVMGSRADFPLSAGVVISWRMGGSPGMRGGVKFYAPDT